MGENTVKFGGRTFWSWILTTKSAEEINTTESPLVLVWGAPTYVVLAAMPIRPVGTHANYRRVEVPFLLQTF